MRDSRIDSLKGLAILLVVIGHILQNTIINYDDNFFFRLIYSFHMPFFKWLNFSDFYIINLFFSSIIIIFISLIFQLFFEKTKLIFLILLGKNKYK